MLPNAAPPNPLPIHSLTLTHSLTYSLTPQVTLNQEAAPMNALCSFVFDAPTSALLGDAATCTTAGNVLTISLAGDVQIRPNR